MTDQERPSECKCVETDAGMVGVYDCPLHSASPEPVPEKNDSIEAEAECLAEATGIPASVFREAMYPPEPVPEQERCGGMRRQYRTINPEADEPSVWHDGPTPASLPEGWQMDIRWWCPCHGTLALPPEHGAEGDENTGESKDLAWAVKRLAAFRDDLYHADHSRVRPVVTAYDLQAVEIVLAHLSAPRRAEGDEWEGERCQSCGRPYERVWAATNALWNAVVGGSAGLRCPECFDREARAAGFSPYWAVADGHFLIPENRRAEGDEEPCQPPGAEPPTCPSCGRWRAWARPVNISESADVCDDPFHDAPVLAEDLRRDWRVYLTRAETAEQKATELAGEAERYREALERIAAATGTSTESHHIAQAALAEGSRKEVTPGQRNRRPEVSE
jgi:hypothetical protein